MALQFNTGATTNQRASTATNPGYSTLIGSGDPFEIGVWVRFASTADRTTAGQTIKRLEHATNTDCMVIGWDGSTGKFSFSRQVDANTATKTWESLAQITADNTWYLVIVQSGNDPTTPEDTKIFVYGGSSTNGDATDVVPTASSTYDSPTGGVTFGNNAASSAPGKCQIRDSWIATRLSSSGELTSLSNGADPRYIHEDYDDTLWSNWRFDGGILLDGVSGLTLTAANSPSATSARHVPYVSDHPDSPSSGITTNLIQRCIAGWRTVKGSDNRCPLWTDVSGAGNHPVQASGAGFYAYERTAPDNYVEMSFDRVTGSSGATFNGTNTAQTSFSVNVSAAGVWALHFPNTDQLFYALGTVSLRCGTNNVATIRVNGADFTPPTQMRWPAGKHYFYFRVNENAGTLTFELQIDDDYQTWSAAGSGLSGTFSRLGPGSGSSSLENRVTIWEILAWNANKSANRTTIATYLRGRWGLSAVRNGVAVLYGTSTFAGDSGSTANVYNRIVPNLLRRHLPATLYNAARDGAQFARIRLTASGGSGTFSAFEVVTQASSGATGEFVLENGGYVFLRNVTGTFNGTNDITGTSSATRTVSAQSLSGNSVNLTDAAKLSQVVGSLQSGTGNKLLVLSCQSNTLNAWGNGAVAYQMDQWFINYIRAQTGLSNCRVLIVGPQPRINSGTDFRAEFVTYLNTWAADTTTALKWFVDPRNKSMFNEYTNSNDYGNTTYFATDATHLNGPGAVEYAALIDSLIRSALGLGKNDLITLFG